MPALQSDFPETVTPSPDDTLLAQESSRRLARFVAAKSKKPLKLRIQPEDARRPCRFQPPPSDC